MIIGFCNTEVTGDLVQRPFLYCSKGKSLSEVDSVENWRRGIGGMQ